LADRRSLLILSFLGVVSVAVVASIAVIGAATPSPSPNASGSSAPSQPVLVTLPPSDRPAVTLRDFSFKTQTLVSVSASTAQSKLWYAQDAWWGGLYSPDANEIHIFRLDWATQTWLDTGTVVDERPGADADFLWTGEHLYVASASKGTASSHRARIIRYTYDPKTSRYAQDADFPVAIDDTGATGIVLDRDSKGVLWVTYVSGGSLWVAHSLTSDADWAAPYKLPVADPLVADDISSLVPFGPGRIGVMWTDQASERVLFASHADGDSDSTWSPVELVATGVGTDDDQLNLKTFEVGGARVVATPIRTTVDVDADQNPLDAQILVMIRGADGRWTSSEAGRVQDRHNRPILLVDPARRLMYVVAQSPTSGGMVSIKRASFDKPIFPPGTGDPLVSSTEDPAIANATSTKQDVSAATGLIVLASDESTGRYLHGAINLGSTPIPSDVAGGPRPDRPAPPTDTVARLLVNDDFGSWPIGQAVTGWTVDATSGSALVSGKGAAHFLTLKSTKAIGSAESCKDFAQAGATHMLVDVVFRPSVGGTGEIRPLGIRTEAGEIVGLRIAADGEFSFFDGAVKQRPVIHLADGRWYRARLNIDVVKRLADLVLVNAAGKTIVKRTGLHWRTNLPAQPRRVCFQVSGTPASLDVDRITVSR
jgi:hypothetical protein